MWAKALCSIVVKNYELQTGGFRTLPFTHEGISKSNESPLPALGLDRVGALRTGEGRIQQKFTKAFGTLVVNLVTRCLDNHPNLIVMDELGSLENEAKRDFNNMCLAV